MTENGKSGDGGGGGGIKTILMVILAVVAAFWAIKLTAWLVKTAFILAAVGAVGYIGYTLLNKRLGSDETPESQPKQLTAEQRRATLGDDPMAEIEATLRELDELKRLRGE